MASGSSMEASAGDIILLDGEPAKCVMEMIKNMEMEVAKDEMIYMIDVGVLIAGERCAQDIRGVAMVDESGSVLVGMDPIPKLIDFPARSGPLEECAEWDDLPEELKNEVHDFVLAAVMNESHVFDKATALAWASTNREIHGEFTDMIYSNITVHFIVQDLDFAEAIHFISSISTAACHSLLKNSNLHISMVFSTDSLCDWMLRGTVEWLSTCQYIIKQLQRKPFNGVRVPWIYHAHGDDDIVHMEWEIQVTRWPSRFYEWETELKIIKECFQQAPLLL